MYNFLVLEEIHQDARESLNAQGRIHRSDSAEEAKQLATESNIDVIITRGTGQVRRDLIDLCPNLKIIARVGVGLDNIDVLYASEKGLKVVNAPGSTTTAVAEHSMLLMMSLLRQLPRQYSEVKKDNWNFRRGFVSAELSGKKLGVIGLGAIGRQVAILSHAFGMTVSYWSRSQKLGFEYEELESLCRTSDVLFLGIALTPETTAFINREKIESMKEGVYIVNTARGGVVHDKDLIDGLNNGRIAGYASDVLSTEPAPHGHPLIHHPKTLFTPHTAAITDETFRKMSTITIGNVLGILNETDYDPASIANGQ